MMHRSHLIATLPASFLFFHAIAVFFGASFVQKVYNTAVWSLLITVLGVVPPLCILPPDFNIWTNNFIQFKHNCLKERWCVYNFLFVLIGSWLGAPLLILDWNTTWQSWPFPCCVGSVIGSVISVLLILALQTHRLLH